MPDVMRLAVDLAWPLFAIATLVVVRAPVKRILSALAVRLENDAPFKITRDGVEVGVSPKIEDTSAKAKGLTGGFPRSLYLSHGTRRAPDLDKPGLEYFRIRLFLDADDASELDDVARVVYHLHQTFRDPDREATNRAESFAVRTAGWGEFNVWAEVYFNSARPKLELERYITLRVPAS